MQDYTYYVPLTGQIVLNFFGTNLDVMDAAYSSLTRIDGKFSGNLYYISEGIPTLRPDNPITLDASTLVADGTDTIGITGATTGTTVDIHNLTTGDKSSSSVANPDTFSTSIAGTIKLTFENFPYLPIEFIITAT